MPLSEAELEQLKSLGSVYFENLLTVAQRHPRLGAMNIPSTAEEFAEKFPETAGTMLQRLQGGEETAKMFFSDAEAAYTSSSTSYNFQEINKMLRSGKRPEENEEGYRQAVTKLIMEMSPLGEEPVTLYRGLRRDDIPELKALFNWAETKKKIDLQNYEGEVNLRGYTGERNFFDDGIISTSTEESGAGRIISGKRDGVLLVITTAPGCRGFAPESEHTMEHEQVLAPTTRFTIQGLARGPVARANATIKRYRVRVTADLGERRLQRRPQQRPLRAVDRRT